jgi:hypothetical protein
VLILAVFFVVEGRGPTPMLPLRLFRQRLFTVSNTAMVVVGFVLMGSSSPLTGAAIQAVSPQEGAPPRASAAPPADRRRHLGRRRVHRPVAGEVQARGGLRAAVSGPGQGV